jgi:hypothetical protein
MGLCCKFEIAVKVTTMKKKTIGILLIILICTACSPSHNAPERNFYFEIHHDRSSEPLASYLENHIAYNKYTITNHSGLEWPFYKELKPDEAIRKDSLMPPHWFLHKMIPKNSAQEIKVNEYLVRIDLLPKPDTLPNYSVEIFRMDSTGLVLSARTGIHYLDSTEFSSKEGLNDLYLKSIIRYSFK